MIIIGALTNMEYSHTPWNIEMADHKREKSVKHICDMSLVTQSIEWTCSVPNFHHAIKITSVLISWQLRNQALSIALRATNLWTSVSFNHVHLFWPWFLRSTPRRKALTAFNSSYWTHIYYFPIVQNHLTYIEITCICIFYFIIR